MCKSSPRHGCGACLWYTWLYMYNANTHLAFESASSYVYPCSVLCASMHWELHQVSYIFGPTLHLRLLYWANHQYIFEYIFENISLNISVAQLCIWGCFIGLTINISLNKSLNISVAPFEATSLGHSSAPQGNL